MECDVREGKILLERAMEGDAKEGKLMLGREPSGKGSEDEEPKLVLGSVQHGANKSMVSKVHSVEESRTQRITGSSGRS